MKLDEAINILGNFCGKRDILELSNKALYDKYGYTQADVFVLFGGSILEGVTVLATAMKEEVARSYIIVGGAGHTTESLRRSVHSEFRDIETEGLSEADIFHNLLEYRYGLHADYIETKSTNCGNNITYLMELMKENNLTFRSIIIAQDATMQCRMES